MYLCVRRSFATFYDCYIGFWNCSDNVSFFSILLLVPFYKKQPFIRKTKIYKVNHNFNWTIIISLYLDEHVVDTNMSFLIQTGEITQSIYFRHVI